MSGQWGLGARVWLGLLALCGGHAVWGQTVVRPVDDGQRVVLLGSTPAQVGTAVDLGALSPDMPANRMLLLLARPAAKEAALQAYLVAVQTTQSAQYHHFMTPEQFGKSFGVEEGDLQAVRNWLASQGFTEDRVLKGRTAIEFSGSVAQVNAAFHTEIHRYSIGGEVKSSNARDAEIPAALAGVVSGVILTNIGPKPLVMRRGAAMLDPVTHRARPMYNEPDPDPYDGCLNGYCYGVTPGDFAAIYDTKPLLAAGVDGKGVTIGVVGDAPIGTSQVQLFRQNFLPQYSATNLPNLILEGPAPTVYGSGDEIEAYLDIEVAGGVAPNATVNFYYGANSYTTNGLGLGMARALEDNVVSVLSVSFGECESELGTSGNEYYNALYEQAAAQGITVVAATGDSGSAACDPPPHSSGYTQATNGLAVSGLASTPYNVAVGGTDFYYPANATQATLSAFWNAPSSSDPNNSADWSSAKGYIPEQVWNISDPTLDQVNFSPSLGAGGGGVSSCVVSSGTSPVVCQSGYPKPSWQIGFGNDTVRDLPDVSLFASSGGNYSFTAICVGVPECPVPNAGPNSTTAPLEVEMVGGTSVAAPEMAGIMALVVQQTGSRQGQANVVLYPLTKAMPTAFHDITVGSNNVDCGAGTPDCGSDGYETGYPATAGYDLASGLGSIDASVLVNNWTKVSLTATITNLTIHPMKAVHGTALTFTVNVSGGATGGQVVLLATGFVGYTTTCAAFPCTFTYNELPGGSYDVSARYAGDGTHAGSTSAGVAVTITPENSQVGVYYQVADTIQGQLAIPLNGQTVHYGGDVSFTAVPAPADITLPADPTQIQATPATGSITVTDKGVAVGSPLTLNLTGQATFEDFDLQVGTHSLVATYSGDLSYNPSNTVSPVATPMVFNVIPSATTLFIFPYFQYVVTGSAGVVTVQVVAIAGPPTGTVTVVVTSATGMVTTLPAANLSYVTADYASEATVTIPAGALAVGSNSVAESYSGDENYLAIGLTGNGTIDSLTASTSMSFSASPSAPDAGQPVILAASVSRNLSPVAAGYPMGTVSITDGSVALGSFPLASDGQGDGVLSFTTSFTQGTHNLVATYGGDTGDLGSTQSLTVVVSAAVLDFSMAATGVTLGAGLMNPTGNSTLTITMNYPQSSATAISLKCSAPPSVPAMSCSVASPLTVAAGAASGTATAMISLEEQTAAVSPIGSWEWRLRGALSFAMLIPVWFAVRRRKWSNLAGMFILTAIAMGVSACGSGTSAARALQPGTYNVTVTGTTGSVVHTATIAVTVQ